MAKLPYRPDIDGLRAVAVLLVVLFHAKLAFSGGHVGVDVFFVISGYLITGLLLKDIRGDGLQLGKFWERRIRRILPALAFVVAASYVAGWYILFPIDFREMGQSVVAQSLLLSNVYFWRESGYFTAHAELKPLLHTWSLAVEEQFYLVFPLLLATIHRFQLRPALTIAFLGIASFAISTYGIYAFPSANFYLLPTRAWELLLGSFLAVFLGAQQSIQLPRWFAEAASCTGIAAIFAAAVLYDAATPFPGPTALAPCLGTTLVIWSNSASLTSICKVLAWRPLVGVGMISYSLYLWHWPLLVFSSYRAPTGLNIWARLGVVAASVAVGYLSWRLIEQPSRMGKLLQGRSRALGAGVLCSVVLFGLGMGVHLQNGVPARFSPGVVAYAAGAKDVGSRKNVTLEQMYSGDLIQLGSSDTSSKNVHLLVWGDSHAQAILPVVDRMCSEFGVRGEAAVHIATAPVLGYTSRSQDSAKQGSAAYAQAVIDHIRDNSIRNVLLVARWNAYVEQGGTEVQVFQKKLAETVRAVRSAESQVWVLLQVPEHEYELPRLLATAVASGRSPSSVVIPVAPHKSSSQYEIFRSIRGLEEKLLDPSEIFRAGNVFRTEVEGRSLYTDNHHLTVHGSMQLRPLLLPLFRNATPSDPSKQETVDQRAKRTRTARS